MRKTIIKAHVKLRPMALSMDLVKISGLNFRKFQFTNGTAFPGIYEHKNNLARYVQIFGNFMSYQEFSI